MGQAVRSSTQVVGFLPCCLLVFPHGTRTSGGQVSAFLAALPPDDWTRDWSFESVEYTIALVNHNHYRGEVWKTDTVCISQKVIDSGWHDFARCDSLLDDGFTSADKGLTFRVSVKGDSLGIKPWSVPVAHDCPSKLSKRLWDDSSFTDAVVATTAGQEFRCHRVVLGSASPVLERMLLSSFKEGVSSKIVIADVEAGELKAMLEYIYTGKVTLDADEVKMMKLADMYDLPTMAAKYGSRMVNKMTATNVKSVMTALRKRGRSEALDDIYKVAKKKVQENPDMIDALVDGD